MAEPVSEIVATDIYLEYTPVKGKPYIREHRVWDRAKFLATRIQENTGPKVKAEDRVIVAFSDKAAYIAQQKAARA